MTDFQRLDTIPFSIQRVDLEDDFVPSIHLGNTVGERDWAWENICLEKEQVERNLQMTIDELRQLQNEHDELKEKLVANERQKMKVQDHLEKQMVNTHSMIKRLNQEKLKNKRLEEEMKGLQGKVNDVNDRNYQLELDINSLHQLVNKCSEQLQIEKAKSKFLEEIYDRKDFALEKAIDENKKLKGMLTVFKQQPCDSSTGKDENTENNRFKRKRIQECRRCHIALEPDHVIETCHYHSKKPVHLPGSDNPKMMLWQCCHRTGKIEPHGCEIRHYHEPL